MSDFDLSMIGLTKGESKVYLALLKRGLSKSGVLASISGVSYSKVYKILSRLERKGLVTHVALSGVRHYKAASPENFLDYFNEEEECLKKKRVLFESKLPDLKKQALLAPSSEATLYSGLKSVTNVFKSMLDELINGQTYYILGVKYFSEEQKNFFKKFHNTRVGKKIKVKMLANDDMRGKLVGKTEHNSEIKYLPQYLISDMQFMIFKEKVFIIIWAGDPIGVLIENKKVMEGFQKYFDAFWKIAKK